MTKKKKVIITVLAVLLLLAGIFYAQKSTVKHRVLSESDFLSAEEKVYGLPLGAYWKPTACMRIITS